MTSPPNDRRWIWFFAVVVVLAIAGITIPIVFNLRQQLKREDLEAAMNLWAENGPTSYNLRYVVKKPNQEPEEYHAEVRNGKVQAAYLNGRPLSPKVWAEHDMPARFRDIKGFLDEDSQPGKSRVFVRAQFDPTNGRLRHYIRSVMGTRQRVEIEVKEFMPLPEL